MVVPRQTFGGWIVELSCVVCGSAVCVACFERWCASSPKSCADHYGVCWHSAPRSHLLLGAIVSLVLTLIVGRRRRPLTSPMTA